MAELIVMTGATGGIGAEAARRMLADGHRLLVGARRPADAPRGAEALPLDLADLESVRTFAAAVRERGDIAALVLNAGIQVTKPQRSAQGYELTFAVNHLAHVLLARLLIAQQPVARVVVTASGVHDPAERLRFPPPPRDADARRLADPDRAWQDDRSAVMAGGRAYSSSKLANILFVRGLAAHAPGVATIAYDPAYVPGTGLAREAPGMLVKLVEWIAPRIMPKVQTSTVARSGAALARLATAPEYAAERGSYWSMRGEVVRATPSVAARDAATMQALWRDSAELVGLPA